MDPNDSDRDNPMSAGRHPEVRNTADSRAAGEAPPRTGRQRTGEDAGQALGTAPEALIEADERAVDANRPADVVGAAGTYGIDAPRMQPNVLQRGYTIGDATHAAETTANAGPVDDPEWDEEDKQRTAAAGSVDIHTHHSEGKSRP